MHTLFFYVVPDVFRSLFPALIFLHPHHNLMVLLQPSCLAAAGDALMLAVESSQALLAKTSTPRSSKIQLDESTQNRNASSMKNKTLSKPSPPSTPSKSNIHSRIPTPVDSPLSKEYVKMVTPEADKNGRRSVHSLSSNSDLTCASTIWTDVVKIFVGPDKAPFLAHRHVLEQIPYFQACFRSSLKETHTGIYELDGCAEALDTVLRYVYARAFEKPVCENRGADDDTCLLQFAKIYHMANYLMMEGLANDVVDEVMHHPLPLNVDALDYLQEQELQDSMMTKVILRKCANRLWGYGVLLNRKYPELIEGYFHKSRDRADRLLNALVDARSPPWMSSRASSTLTT